VLVLAVCLVEVVSLTKCCFHFSRHVLDGVQIRRWVAGLRKFSSLATLWSTSPQFADLLLAYIVHLLTIRLPDNTCRLKTAFSELNYFNQAYITQSVVLAVAVLLRPL